MSETPQFLKELEEKHEAAEKELAEARAEWERAKEAVGKFPGFELTGMKEVPQRDMWFLGLIDGDFDCPLQSDGYWSDRPENLRFILRKIEPPPETKPVRETILAEAKELAKKILSNPLVWGCRPETIQLANRVNDIPDQPEPRTVWACPGRIINSLKVFKKMILMDQAKDKIPLGTSARYLSLVDQLLDACHSTREATVEEVRKAAEVSGPFLVGDGSIPKIWANWDVIIRALNRAGLTVVKENSDG